MPESSLQSENITYRPHAARGCVKLQSKHIRNTYDRYTTIIIIIYENCTVRLANVGLAQARPNYTLQLMWSPSSPYHCQPAIYRHAQKKVEGTMTKTVCHRQK